MPRPVPGKNYTVVKGDTLWDLSAAAYGDPWKWEDIYNANQVQLTPDTPNKWGYSMQPGQVIFIPPDKEIDELKASSQTKKKVDREPGEMSIFLAGESVIVKTGRLTRTMDTPSDGFTGTTVYFPLEERYQKIFKPFNYQSAEAFLGPELQCTAKLYMVKPSIEPGQTGQSISFKAFSHTVDIVDSTSKPPYEQKNVTLEERIRSLVEPKGINVVWKVETEDKPFKKVKIAKTEQIFKHISVLAKQRSVVFSTSETGDLVCENATTEGSVGTIIEGDGLLMKMEPEFDGRKAFSQNVAYGTGPKKNIKAVSKNDWAPSSRQKSFLANDMKDDDIQEAADFERNRALVEALTLPIPVRSWYAPDGKVWKPNTLVTLISPSAFLPDGFTFLIKSVEFTISEKGSTATLSLVPPTVYTKDPIINPWA